MFDDKEFHRPISPPMLALTLSVGLLCADAYAQTPPAAIPISGATGRSLSNLAAPNSTYDTFLGTDSTGPYVLSWKNIQTGFGAKVEVVVDGRPLLGVQYTIDPAKGEIVFALPLKRTQMARVSYGYYPGTALRNPNPAASAPLTASIGKLQVLAIANPSDGSQRMVWGVGDKSNLLGGGLSSQFFFAPESLDGKTVDPSALSKTGMKLGYNVGNSLNGIDVGYLRTGKDFNGYGKQVGLAESAQNLSLGGRFNPMKALGVTYNKTDNRNLDGKAGVYSENLGARLGGVGGLPTLAFNQTIDDKADAKGVRTKVETDKTELTAGVGALAISARDASTQTTTADGKSSGTEQQVIDLKLAQKNQPALGFNRTENGTIDNTGKRAQSVTDTLSVGVSAKKNAPAVSYLRTDEDRTDVAGAKTNVTTDKADLSGKLGRANYTAKTLQGKTLLPDGKETGLQQNAYGVSLGPTSFLRTEDQKRDTAGVWNGVVADKFDASHKVGRATLALSSFTTVTTTPDSKQASVDTQRLDVKLPASGSGPAVNVSRLTDEKTDIAGAKVSVETQKADVSGKLGTAAITAATTQTSTTTPDPKTTGSTKETTVALTGNGGAKGTGATLAITGGSSQTGAAAEQKQGLSVKLQPTPTLAVTAEQRDQLLLPTGGAARTVSTQGASAELKPGPATTLTGSWKTSVDGDTERSITEYGAQLGRDKNALQFTGGMVTRSNGQGGLSALDSSRASLKVRAARGLTLSTGYLQNPEEKGIVSAFTRREFGLEAKAGSLELGGVYSATELNDLSPEQLRKQAGAMEYGEYTLSVGLRFGATTKLTTTVKDSFYAGVAKGQRVVGLGFTQSAGDAFMTLTGTMTTNRSLLGAQRNDVKAEAKVGVKF